MQIFKWENLQIRSLAHLLICSSAHLPISIIAQRFGFDNHEFSDSENWERFRGFLGVGVGAESLKALTGTDDTEGALA